MSFESDPGTPPNYRVLVLSAAGAVLASEPIAAADDDAALQIVASLVGAHAVELWDGLRFIEHFQPVLGWMSA